ncbi:MAG: helix-turn-helix transcriptional regulator [Chloroflexi bacterium]|nr:helix-turn-helix transcriptional regulator [Chloroflexota bacterium]
MAVDRTERSVPPLVPRRGANANPAAPRSLPTLRAEWSGLRFAYTLTRLDDLIVEDVTEGARELLGLPMERIVGMPALELVDPKDRAGVQAAVEALRSGGIDFFMAHRRGFGARDPSKGYAVWVYAMDLGGVRYALSRWMDAEALARVEPESVDALARCAAIALVDGRGVVKAVVEHIDLGLAVRELVGRPILPAAELQRILDQPDIGTIRARGLSVAGPVTVPRRAGGTMTLKGVATALVGSDHWLVALLDLDAPPSGREAELEGHLWRIAAEIEASGLLLRAGSMPQVALARVPAVSALSARQWEVLRRLVAGQRVPTIARELYVAQSTVRNHLSAIFERFGVHSQPELLARLRSTDALPASTDALPMA